MSDVRKLNPKNLVEAKEMFDIISKQVCNDSLLSAVLKDEITRAADKRIFTQYGKNTENSSIVGFEKHYNKTVIPDLKRYELDIGTFDNVPFKLVGYIDGYIEGPNNSKFLFEIKNRKNKLFHRVRDYENVQVQLYMKLTGMNRAYLVEHFEGDYNFNIIESEEFDILRKVRQACSEMIEEVKQEFAQ